MLQQHEESIPCFVQLRHEHALVQQCFQPLLGDEVLGHYLEGQPDDTAFSTLRGGTVNRQQQQQHR